MAATGIVNERKKGPKKEVFNHKMCGEMIPFVATTNAKVLLFFDICKEKHKKKCVEGVIFRGS